jgi:2-polyprenyl-3-methyl-5-hydroxy-6-metoxy-1,4-benzoquinol methylase
LTRARRFMTEVNSLARQGFGNAAHAYARGRPEYPAEMVSWLRQNIALGLGRPAIDVGAGTGKFTKLLLQTGATVIAIEPVDLMRAEPAQYCLADRPPCP